MADDIGKFAFDKIGNLNKVGAKVKNWQERVFALHIATKTLVYFKKPSDCAAYLKLAVQGVWHPQKETSKLAAGVIPLSGGYVYLADYVDGKEQTYMFELAVATRIYYFYAASPTEMKEWLFVLTQAGLPLRTSRILATNPPATDSQVAAVAANYGYPPHLRTERAKHGWVHKRGEVNTAFKKRLLRAYGAGSDAKVDYFDSIHEEKAKGSFVLTGATVSAPANSLEFTITVRAKSRSYVFKATTEQERREWVDFFNGSDATTKLLATLPAESSSSTPAVAASTSSPETKSDAPSPAVTANDAPVDPEAARLAEEERRAAEQREANEKAAKDAAYAAFVGGNATPASEDPVEVQKQKDAEEAALAALQAQRAAEAAQQQSQQSSGQSAEEQAEQERDEARKRQRQQEREAEQARLAEIALQVEAEEAAAAAERIAAQQRREEAAREEEARIRKFEEDRARLEAEQASDHARQEEEARLEALRRESERVAALVAAEEKASADRAAKNEAERQRVAAEKVAQEAAEEQARQDAVRQQAEREQRERDDAANVDLQAQRAAAEAAAIAEKQARDAAATQQQQAEQTERERAENERQEAERKIAEEQLAQRLAVKAAEDQAAAALQASRDEEAAKRDGEKKKQDDEMAAEMARIEQGMKKHEDVKKEDTPAVVVAPAAEAKVEASSTPAPAATATVTVVAPVATGTAAAAGTDEKKTAAGAAGEKKLDEMTTEELTEKCTKGTMAIKLGNYGSPKLHRFFIGKDKGVPIMQWDSAKKKDTDARMVLKECKLVLGIGDGLFKKEKKYTKQYAGVANVCLSLIGPKRSLDIVFQSPADFQLWSLTLKRLCLSVAPSTPAK